MYSLGQAARAVGKAKSTLSRDVKTGRISATRKSDGSLAIDPAELHRVYPPSPPSNGVNGSGNGAPNDSQPVATTTGMGFEVELLRERIAEQAEAIRDLRARLDAESAERRQLAERLTGLLTHRQASSVPSTPRLSDHLRGPWWRRWIR